MTKAKSRHGKLKGAVLLMVLAVMTVLIIMLAGAMAIASTAGNRAITKYEESQAYYTERSGIEVITQTLMGDSVHVDKGNNNDGNNHKSQNTFSSTSKSQALAFEEAITGVNKLIQVTRQRLFMMFPKALQHGIQFTTPLVLD